MEGSWVVIESVEGLEAPTRRRGGLERISWSWWVEMGLTMRMIEDISREGISRVSRVQMDEERVMKGERGGKRGEEEEKMRRREDDAGLRHGVILARSGQLVSRDASGE